MNDGEVAYEAYRQDVGDFQIPLPWDQLPTKARAAWNAAARSLEGEARYRVEHEGGDRWLKSDTSGVRECRHNGGVFLHRYSRELVYINDLDLDLIAAFRADAGRRELEHVDRNEPNTFERCAENLAAERSRRDSASVREGASSQGTSSSEGGHLAREAGLLGEGSNPPKLDAGRSEGAPAGQPTVSELATVTRERDEARRAHCVALTHDPAKAWLTSPHDHAVAHYDLEEADVLFSGAVPELPVVKSGPAAAKCPVDLSRCSRDACRSGCDRVRPVGEQLDPESPEPAEPTEPTDSAALVARCNELAAVMQRAIGWSAPEGYEFHRNLHKPRAVHAWELAVVVLEHLEGHEMADALAEVQGE